MKFVKLYLIAIIALLVNVGGYGVIVPQLISSPSDVGVAGALLTALIGIPAVDVLLFNLARDAWRSNSSNNTSKE